jgi:hypothetical protein
MTRQSDDPYREGRGYIHPVSPDRAAILTSPEYKGTQHKPAYQGSDAVIERHGDPAGGPSHDYAFGTERKGSEQHGDAARQADELHEQLLASADAQRYSEEYDIPEHLAARAKRQAERDDIIAAHHFRADDPEYTDKMIHRNAALYAHKAAKTITGEDPDEGFVPPEPLADYKPDPQPSRFVRVEKRGRKVPAATKKP